jgi:hypothetical protein
MPKKVTAYVCQYGCDKLSMDEKFIVEHERMCFKNPERETCDRCQSMVKLWCPTAKMRINWPAFQGCKEWEGK